MNYANSWQLAYNIGDNQQLAYAALKTIRRGCSPTPMLARLGLMYRSRPASIQGDLITCRISMLITAASPRCTAAPQGEGKHRGGEAEQQRVGFLWRRWPRRLLQLSLGGPSQRRRLHAARFDGERSPIAAQREGTQIWALQCGGQTWTTFITNTVTCTYLLHSASVSEAPEQIQYFYHPNSDVIMCFTHESHLHASISGRVAGEAETPSSFSSGTTRHSQCSPGNWPPPSITCLKDLTQEASWSNVWI